jgi:hypothetical protein
MGRSCLPSAKATYRDHRDRLRAVSPVRGHITAESEIYDRARRPYKRHPVIVFISMLVEPRVDSPEERQVSPISRRVSPGRNVTRDSEKEGEGERARLGGARVEKTCYGVSEDAGQ